MQGNKESKDVTFTKQWLVGYILNYSLGHSVIALDVMVNLFSCFKQISEKAQANIFSLSMLFWGW